MLFCLFSSCRNILLSHRCSSLVNPSLAVKAPRRQRGVAMVIALFTVAMATVIATAILSQSYLQMRRTSNLFNSEQALQYAISGERFMAAALQLHRENKETDDKLDLWYTAPLIAPLANGGIAANLLDQQGCFNVNSVVDTAGQPRGKRIEQYRRLLTVLSLPLELADVLRDWVDADDLPEGNGAEEDTYLSRTPAYRAANGPIESPSELQLMAGYTPEVLEILMPHVCALPVRQAKLNINFVTAPVLQSLSDKIDSSIAEELVSQAEEIPFAEDEAFLSHQLLEGIELETDQIGVITDFYKAEAKVDVGELQLRFVSLFQRGADGKVRVVARARGAL